jgi:hypothetical protein
MTDTELKTIIEKHLSVDTLKQWGQILYSGIDTLRSSGGFYFIGFNPAKDGTNPRLCDIPLGRRNWSAYTQQCWTHRDCDPTVCQRTGKSQHQMRVQRIMAELGLKPEKTFATNLIFVESENVNKIKRDPLFKTYLESCWQVHRKMLAEIRPHYIVCLGNGKTESAFSLLRERAEHIQNERASLAFKSFAAEFDLADGVLLTKVIGVRHPSRPMNPQNLRCFVGC